MDETGGGRGGVGKWDEVAPKGGTLWLSNSRAHTIKVLAGETSLCQVRMGVSNIFSSSHAMGAVILDDRYMLTNTTDLAVSAGEM